MAENIKKTVIKGRKRQVAPPFEQTSVRLPPGTFIPNFKEIGPAVSSKKSIVDGRTDDR